MRQKMLYLMAGSCLLFQTVFVLSYAQCPPSQQSCRDELLKREDNLRQAKASVQTKLNRMYERINRMKMRAAELENGLTQIDDHLKRVGMAIVDLNK